MLYRIYDCLAERLPILRGEIESLPLGRASGESVRECPEPHVPRRLRATVREDEEGKCPCERERVPNHPSHLEEIHPASRRYEGRPSLRTREHEYPDEIPSVLREDRLASRVVEVAVEVLIIL